MKNRNLKHSDHWQTPDEFYHGLNAEFGFDFDPCPLNHDMSWNGIVLHIKIYSGTDSPLSSNSSINSSAVV